MTTVVNIEVIPDHLRFNEVIMSSNYHREAAITASVARENSQQKRLLYVLNILWMNAVNVGTTAVMHPPARCNYNRRKFNNRIIGCEICRPFSDLQLCHIIDQILHSKYSLECNILLSLPALNLQIVCITLRY